MAENPNVGSRKKTGIKGWFGRSGKPDDLDDVNMPNVSEHPNKPSGHQKHHKIGGITKIIRAIFPKSESGKETDDRHNTPAGNDRGTATAGETVKSVNTEMEQRVPPRTESHTNVSAQISTVSTMPEIFNRDQEQKAPTDTLLSTETHSDISTTHPVTENLHPGLEETGPSRFDRSAWTSRAVDPRKAFLAGFRDNDLRKITAFYRQRLEDAVEECVEGFGLALLNENIIDSQEYQHVRELVESTHRNKASKFLFDKVFEGGAESGRAMWAIFDKMQDTKPKLRGILKEIQDKGSNLPEEASRSQIGSKVPHYLEEIHNEHKETLRKQCEKLIVEPGDNEGIVSLDRYTDLKIISSPRQRSLLEHELLSRGAEHEKWQKLNVQQLLEKIRIDQLFRSSFGRTSLCGTSVVTGVAGIGKTTMVQKIVHDWAAGKIYQQFNFVFLFKFRELNVKGKRTSLNRMVLDSYPYFQKHLQNVWEEPNNILIIFDGLDEFEETIDFTDQHRNAATEYKCFDPECRCEVSDIVRCLVQGKVLKGCSVLITSRPIGLELLDQAKVDLWVEILGFFEEERGEYFRRFFGNQELADEVFAYVKQNDILYTLCFNPCYCRIICSTLEPLFKRGKGFEAPLPKTVSDLFSNYIASLLNRWGCSVENRGVLLQKIGAMAYEGVCKKKLVFYADDFRRHHLEPSQFTSGFMMEILDEDPSSKAAVHTFPHLTIQEFLAALSFLLKSPPEGIKTILNKAYGNSGGRFEIFLRFLIGLSSSSSAQQLQEKLGLFLESSTLQVKDWLKAQLEEDFKNVHSEWRKRKLLNTFYLLYESQDRKLMREIIGSKNTTDFSGVPLNLMDCRVLATVLEPCEMIEELNLVYCGIEDDQIQRILPVLHKCKTLRLTDNNLKDSGVIRLWEALEKPDCKIETLELNNNRLTDVCIEGLCSALEGNQSLSALDLNSDVNIRERANCFTFSSFSQLENLVAQRKNLKLIRMPELETRESSRVI